MRKRLPVGNDVAHLIQDVAQAVGRATDDIAATSDRQLGDLSRHLRPGVERLETTERTAAHPLTRRGDRAPLERDHHQPVIAPESDPATERMRAIYGPALHTDRSELAREYARSLAKAPNWLHRSMAEFMRDEPEGIGGLWLGGRALPELGHPNFSFDQPPRGYPAGTTWNDVAGAYHRRALLLGTGPTEGGTTGLHEFSHAVDDLTDMPSHQPAFERTYDAIVPHLREIGPELGEYFAQSGTAGREELFAEGLAWFYDGGNLNDFYGSTATAYHLDGYFVELQPYLRWAAP